VLPIRTLSRSGDDIVIVGARKPSRMVLGVGWIFKGDGGRRTDKDSVGRTFKYDVGRTVRG